MTRTSSLIAALSVVCVVCGSRQAFAAPLYLSDAANHLVVVDTASGNVDLVGGLNAQFTDIAFNPAGRLFGVTPTHLYEIDPANAWSTLLGAHGFGYDQGIDALAFGPDGSLYGAGNNVLVRIDARTAAAELVGDLSGFQSAGDLSLASDGRLLLSTDSGDLVEVHTDGSGASLVGAIPFNDVYGLGTDPDGVLFGVRGNFDLLVIDPHTGAGQVTDVLEPDFLMGWVWGASVQPAHAPEPSTLAFLLLPALIYGWKRRLQDQFA